MDTETKGKSEVRIRPLVKKDIDPILALWWTSFISDVDKDMIASQLGGPLDLSLVAEAEGRLVGFILARIVYVDVPMRQRCSVYAIAVHPEYRRQGIGSQLVAQLKNLCGSKGIQTARVAVHQNNTELINYFERLGFRRSDMLNLELPCGK